MKDATTITARIAEPYAEALMSLAQSQDLTDRLGDDVAGLLALIKESHEFSDFLINPVFKVDQKKAVLQQLLGEQVHPYMLNFLKLLVDQRRISVLPAICEQYQELLRKLKQAVLAEVTSAVELSDEQKQAVREKVIAITGAREVDLETQVDRDLIGGVIIKVGSQVVDASLRGQLRRISLRLSGAA
jgi:F-type H+-transporting ATPase subunit delta